MSEEERRQEERLWEYRQEEHAAEEATRSEWQQLEAERDALRAENARLREETRWIPVTERLPEPGQSVLIVIDNGVSVFHVEKARHYPDVLQWTTDDGGYYHGDKYGWVTHWKPLPQPPEEAQP